MAVHLYRRTYVRIIALLGLLLFISGCGVNLARRLPGPPDPTRPELTNLGTIFVGDAVKVRLVQGSTIEGRVVSCSASHVIVRYSKLEPGTVEIDADRIQSIEIAGSRKQDVVVSVLTFGAVGMVYVISLAASISHMR